MCGLQRKLTRVHRVDRWPDVWSVTPVAATGPTNASRKAASVPGAAPIGNGTKRPARRCSPGRRRPAKGGAGDRGERQSGQGRACGTLSSTRPKGPHGEPRPRPHLSHVPPSSAARPGTSAVGDAPDDPGAPGTTPHDGNALSGQRGRGTPATPTAGGRRGPGNDGEAPACRRCGRNANRLCDG